MFYCLFKDSTNEQKALVAPDQNLYLYKSLQFYKFMICIAWVYINYNNNPIVPSKDSTNQ